jgi:hypothetical protein
MMGRKASDSSSSKELSANLSGLTDLKNRQLEAMTALMDVPSCA